MKSLLDGSDCVMLSGETAKGDYPVQCIKTMSALTQEAEACLWNERFFEELLHGTDCDLTAVLEKDKADLLFDVEMNVDMVFASFIRDAQGVKDVRKVLGKVGEKILTISKIENLQGKTANF